MNNIQERVVDIYDELNLTLSEDDKKIIGSWEGQNLDPNTCIECIKIGVEMGWTVRQCDEALRAECPEIESEASEEAPAGGDGLGRSNGLDHGSDGEIVTIDEGKPVERGTKDPKFIMTARGLHHGDDWLSAPFKVLGRARDANGTGWARLLEWFDPDGNKHTYPVSDAKLHGDTSVLCGDLAQQGLKIATSAGKRALFVAYLNHVEVTERVATVTRTGWHLLSKGKVFVLPDRTIGNSGDETVIFTGAQKVPYSARGTLEQWKDTVGKLVAGHDRAVFSVSAALAATLAGLIDAEGGGFNLYGNSSSGKTTLIQAAASVWGRGDSHGFGKTWSATANGIEGAAVLHNDLPLMLDELGVADPRDVGKVAYTLSGGTGKSRATRDGTLRDSHKWRAMILSTGELRVVDKIAEGAKRTRAGQEVRIIDIPADAGAGYGVFNNGPGAEDLANEIQAAAISYYGTAGPAFVECLLKEGLDSVTDPLREVIAEFQRNKLHDGADGQVKRASKRFALVAAAGEMAIHFGIVPWENGSVVAAAERLFDAWLDARGGIDAAEVRNAAAQVRGIIERHGRSRFDPADVDGSLVGHPAHDRLGWVRGEGKERQWLIPPGVWKTVFADGFDPTMVARVLCERGMLTRGQRQFTNTVRIEGQPRRVYVLTAKIVDEQEADLPAQGEYNA